MMVAVPLSVLDAFVLWWIFFALHSTMKILELRQNRIKLLLYQRFRSLLAFFAIGVYIHPHLPFLATAVVSLSWSRVRW